MERRAHEQMMQPGQLGWLGRRWPDLLFRGRMKRHPHALEVGSRLGHS